MNVDLLVLQKSLTGSYPSNQFVPILPCQPVVFLETANQKMTRFPALLQTNGFLFITVSTSTLWSFFLTDYHCKEVEELEEETESAEVEESVVFQGEHTRFPDVDINELNTFCL